MFTTTLFTIAKRWKQVKCLLTADRMKKMWHIHTGMLLLLLLSRFSRVWLCDPIDCSPPGSPIPGILQARTLEWVAISFSSAWKWKESKVAQSCLTLGNPMDWGLPGSSVHGTFQARVVEWDAIAFSALECYSALKRRKFCHMLEHEWNLSTFHQVK